MVNWFRLFNVRWHSFEDSLSGKVEDPESAAFAAAFEYQSRFENIGRAEDTSGELSAWFKEKTGGPGVLVLIRGKKNSSAKMLIDVIHHLKQNKDEEGREFIMGLSSMDSSASVVSILVEDLFADLVSAKKLSSVGVKDRYLPSLEGLISGKHKIREKFTPQILDDTPQVDALTERPRGIYIPCPIWHLIWENVTNAEKEFEIDGANQPIPLLEKLIDGMKQIRDSDKVVYKRWEPSAQRLAEYLWTAANELSAGVTVYEESGTLDAIHLHQKCYKDFIAFHEGVEATEERSPGASDRATEERKVDTGEGDPLGRKRKASQEDDRGNKGPSVARQSSFAEDQDNRGEEKSAEDLPPTPTGVPMPIGSPPTLAFEGIPTWLGTILNGVVQSTKAMEAAGVSLKDFALINKYNIEKKEEKNKATSKWLPNAVFLMKVLSSEDGWNTQGMPELTEFAKQLVEMKISQATQLVREKYRGEKWCGCILKSGLSQLLKRGFKAEDVNVAPSGFSVLFFHPSSYSETDGEEFGLQQIRESFGDGELNEEMARAFNRMQIFVPDSTYKAADQLRAAISFLESICGDMTIATSGYRKGLMAMEENRQRFEAEYRENKMFLFNYLYLLDRVFQAFCEEIQKQSGSADPIRAFLSVRKATFMEDLIEGPLLLWLVQGIRLSLQPPLLLAGRETLAGIVDLNQGSSNRGKPGSGGKSPRTRSAQGELSEEGQASLKAEERVAEWQLPEGKDMGSFFNPHQKDNTRPVPRVTHPHTGRPAQICLRYQIGREGCRFGKGCAMAHVRPKDIPAAAREKLTNHLRKVYQGSGS